MITQLKTSLVKRLSELLDIANDTVYFNFAEIGEMKSWEIEDTFEETIDNATSNKIFIYDEFQYAATLDESGAEKDNKTGLKPFWELMDTGILHRRIDTYDIQCIKRVMDYAYRINTRCHIELSNGVWTNSEECLSHFPAFERSRFETVFNGIGSNDRGYYDEDGPFVGNCSTETKSDESEKNTTDIFIKSGYIDRIKNLYNKVNPYLDIIDFREKISKFDIYELSEFVEGIIKKSEKGYDMDFSKSVIFVLMNLDEAYEMSFNVNPDMVPDQFHKMTKKLTIVDIKEALKRRFRNEQISRLGNLFMIYPSFSEDSFRKIIRLLLDRYSNTVCEKWGIKPEFDTSIEDIIYKDSVFPTHGTRPIISSVHEIIKTKLPSVVDDLCKHEVKSVDRMVYSYADESVKVISYNGDEVVGEMEIHQNLRVDNHRSNDKPEQQAMIAVHESGHFVMYAKLCGKTPEKLCSSTLHKEAGGFMLKDDDDSDKLYTKEDYLNDIKVGLGGYVAEKMVFGDTKRSGGASSDLNKITTLAGSMVRRFGLGNNPEVTTYLTTERCTDEGMIIRDDTQATHNAEIRKIIRECTAEVEKTFSTPCWKAMLKESAQYLSDNIVMPKEVMEEIYSKVPDEFKVRTDDRFYRDKIKNF